MAIDAIAHNIEEFSSRHHAIEAARNNLSPIEPGTRSVDTSGSEALAAFAERVEQLANLLGKYKLKLWEDSRSLYEASNQFIQADRNSCNYSAMIYESTIRPSIWSDVKEAPKEYYFSGTQND